MGYTHGNKWTEKLIIKEIEIVRKTLNISYMPSKNDMRKVTGSDSLACAVTRHGGCAYYKELLGFAEKESCSSIGDENELYVIELIKTMGNKAIKTPHRYPYDILVNDTVKIDVKSANPILSKIKKMNEFVFSINNKYPKCDLFIFITMFGQEKEAYVIPSKFIIQSQLGIGETSKYDCYKNRFDYIDTYTTLFEKVV